MPCIVAYLEIVLQLKNLKQSLLVVEADRTSLKENLRDAQEENSALKTKLLESQR